MSSWPLNGKKGGNRKHSKIDTLPPEMKATVEEMCCRPHSVRL